MHIVAMDIDISVNMTRGYLGLPDANIRVYWEPEREVTKDVQVKFLKDLDEYKEGYNVTMGHMTGSNEIFAKIFGQDRLEVLTKTHRIVGYTLDVGYNFGKGQTEKPDANIKVFWEPMHAVDLYKHSQFLVDLKRSIGSYDCKLEHIV